jgi:hypothetical protein
MASSPAIRKDPDKIEGNVLPHKDPWESGNIAPGIINLGALFTYGIV